MYYQLQRRAVASFGSYCAPEDLHRVLQTARTAESLKLSAKNNRRENNPQQQPATDSPWAVSAWRSTQQ